MKKILSLLLSAVLLLSAGTCAYGQEAPVSDHSSTISDMYILVNNQIIDLSNITLELDVTGEGKARAAQIHLDADGQTVAEIGLTLVDRTLVLHMNSASMGHTDYGLDLASMLSAALEKGIDSAVSFLQSIDPTGTAEGLIDALVNAGGQALELPPEPEQPAEEPEAKAGISLPDLSIDGDILSLLEDCVSEPETVHMGGMEYDPNGGVAEMPEDDYQVRTFTFDTDTICQILDMIHVNGQSLSAGEQFRQAGVDLSLDGVFYDGELAHIGQISSSLSNPDLTLSFGGGYNQRLTDLGSSTSYSFGFAKGADLETLTGGSVSFTVADSQHEGEPFTPDSVDMDSLIMLSDMDTETATAELTQALSGVIADMLMPVMSAIYPDADMEGLTEEPLE